MSLEKANKETQPSPTQIFLPENPFRDFYEDLIKNGLAFPSRICVTSDAIEDLDLEYFQYPEKIKSVIFSNRIKLYDQTDFHMELVTFSNYVKTQGFMVDSELNNMQNNGLKLVVTKKKVTTGSWLLNGVISAASYCWCKIKSAANAVTSFCYSIVQWTVNLPGMTLFFLIQYFLYLNITKLL